MKSLVHYELLGSLFRYPDANFNTKLLSNLKMIEENYIEVFPEMKRFVDAIASLNTKEKQEYYLKTFDVKAICYLDIGYMMFGEDYKRAQLLVNLQNEHNEAGVDCGTELADHLPYILTLISKTKNDDFKEELGFIITMPTIKFMLTKFEAGDNHYEDIFKVLLYVLQNDFKGENMMEYTFAEEKFNGKNEFLIQSPKMTLCDSNCKPKRFKS